LQPCGSHRPRCVCAAGWTWIPGVVASRMRTKSGIATSHDTPTVAHAMKEPSNDMGATAFGAAAGTMPVVLFTEACINITSSRLPPDFQYTQDIATDSAVTCSR